MGGGISSEKDLEEVLACTMMIGEAMIQGLDPRYIRFPDMHRLYDFHVGAKELPAPIGTFRDPDEEESDEEEVEEEKTELEIDSERHLVVYIDKDRIVLDKSTLNQPNRDGWTPLHACCHTPNTVAAGKTIIDYLQKQKDEDFDKKTLRGPGSFSTGWTALHIAGESFDTKIDSKLIDKAAYGLEEMVSTLVKAGADPNVTNSVEWTPLHEACHRGFTKIAKTLIQGGATLDQKCPPFALCPYPAQYPLAEACRQGHAETAKMLLEMGAEKNAMNEIEWTPVHEAAYQNRLKCIELLVTHGADVDRKTNRGFTPAQLTISYEIRNILLEVGQNKEDLKTGTVVKEAKEEDRQLSPGKSGPISKKEDFALLGDLPSIEPIKIVEKVEKKQKKSRKTKKSKNGHVPEEFQCEISRKLMRDPVKSPYGNSFDRKIIESWIQDFGHRCPITGQPLSIGQLCEDKEMKKSIAEWMLSKTMTTNSEESRRDKPELSSASPADDELYDF